MKSLDLQPQNVFEPTGGFLVVEFEKIIKKVLSFWVILQISFFLSVDIKFVTEK